MSTEAHPGRTETAGPAPDPRSATSVSDADLAARLVADAGTLAGRLREGGLDVSRKTTISDVVTEADTAAARRITGLLAHRRPEDGVLGEEGTLVPGRHDRRWVVDPVDGTYNFVAGSDYWCSAVAVAGGDDYLLGAVHRPVTGETFLGGSDVPTRRNGVPLPGSPPGTAPAAAWPPTCTPRSSTTPISPSRSSG